MAQAPGEQNPQDRSCPRYLPYLTWTMLGLLFTWFVVWFFFYRPTEAEELRLASYHQALRYVEATYIYDVEQEGLHDAAMGGMMRSLPDKYSVYVDKRGRRRLEQRTEGQFGGIGVLVTARDGAAVIVEVTAGGPAEEAGVEAGDIITGVDGEDVTELSLDEVVDRIRGEIGADVTIGLRRPATEGRLTVTIERERVVVPNIIWRALEDGIVHLEFRSFDRDCPSEMEDALEQITEEGVRGLILDVRNNAGGLMPAAVKISDMFLSGGLIMAVRTREDSRPHESHASVVLPPDVPVVVLVNYATASAAEILAGSLQANGRASVLGTPTLGKGSVTEVMSLPDGSALNLTVGRYVLSNDRMVEGRGIQPDVVVGEPPPRAAEGPEAAQRWLEGRAQMREQQLQKAVELVKSKMSEPTETKGEGDAADAHEDSRDAGSGQ